MHYGLKICHSYTVVVLLDVLYSSLGMYNIWKLQVIPDFVFGQQGRRHPKHMGCLKGLCDVSTLREAAQKNCPEAGVLKKLSLVGLAKLSRLKYSWLRFGLASAGYRVLGVHDKPVYTAGYNSQPISTEQYEIPEVSPLRLVGRDKLTQFSD